MTRKAKTGAAEADKAETKAGAKTARAGKKAVREARSAIKAKASKTKPGGFDFIGKVESLVVKGGSSDAVFEFGLRGRHGSRQTFRLKTSDSFSLNIVAPIVTAAHANDAKIGVRVLPEVSDVPYVMEVAIRPKLGKES
jgi:hypothetical protein